MNYNNIPVFYCKNPNCLSIAIRCDDPTSTSIEGVLGDEFKYCKTCGGVEIGVMNFSNWEILYEDTHGYKLLDTK
jgi:hypothetical protein